jgi:hypothetical protein
VDLEAAHGCLHGDAFKEEGGGRRPASLPRPT